MQRCDQTMDNGRGWDGSEVDLGKSGRWSGGYGCFDLYASIVYII